ncbi:MAG: trypsin-like peptidase domain-containing protein [Clostridia bacterium]|nr:trypsin-like peptidase domain-containing protein [Clostridia bacterium]
MEEEKIPLEGEPSAQEINGQATPPIPDEEKDGSKASAGTASEEEPLQEGDASEKAPVAEEPSTPAVDWQFGAEPSDAKKRPGKGAFFAIFGAVFGVCLLLLAVTLWLGDEGFQIIRNIYNERVIYVRQDDGTSGLLTPNEAADKVKKSTVTIVVTTANSTGHGSGFVYTADGYIITNHHVIESAVSVQVVLPDGRTVDATVRGSNAAADVAVLKVEADGLVPAELGKSMDLLVGDDVVAVGTPAKLDYAGTSTFGKVSATNRLIPLTDTTGTVAKKMTLIQTDTSVNPGNSGGPLADMYGRVVGVVVMKVTSYDDIGFALPIDGVKIIADAIIQKGSFDGVNPIAEGRSLLGLTGHGGEAGKWYSDIPDPITGAMISSDTALEGYHHMACAGIYVTEVNGGNAVGKMQAGDIICKANGLNMRDVTDLIEEVNRHHVGESVILTVWRNGETIEVSIVLYEQSAP